MLEEVVVHWQEIRWIWWMWQNIIAQFIQLWKHWLCAVQSGAVIEKNWALLLINASCRCTVHLINLLSILLRCNSFTRIQTAVVDQTSSKQWPWLFFFFGASLTLGSALELLISLTRESQVAQMLKNLPVVQENCVQSLCREDSPRREWLPTAVFMPG